MVAQAVEAVWIFRFGVSTFKGTYGRFDKSVAGDSYTKNFLQVSGECRDLMAATFGIPMQAGARHEVAYVWPGGEVQGGHINWSVDRFHLNWPMRQAPLPWKVTPAPSETSVSSIPGDPKRLDQNDADAEWESLSQRDLEPYLVAVKLRGEQDRLHVRSYLGKAPADMPWASLERLPAVVQDEARRTGGNRNCASLEVTGDVTAEPEVISLIEQLERNPNVLLTGPPGTGKTVLLEKLTRFVEHSAGGLLFDSARIHDAWSEGLGGKPGKASTVVLHPSYSYENLVVGLMPEPSDAGGVAVKAVSGPLVNLAQYAQDADRRALLVLDEFNRGNAAAVLGDALALLDPDKRGNARVNLPYSGITVPPEYASNGNRDVDNAFTLPPNLWIVAAMNSSDRSVAPLDAALRRRFSIIEMPPNYAVLAQHLGADEGADFTADLSQWSEGTVAALAVKLLKALNKRIDAVLGTDFRLGQSNFWSISGDTVEDLITSLAEAFDHRVVATLRLAMQDDDGALAAVLRAGTADAPAARKGVARWREAPAELGTYASPRLHLHELSRMKPEAVIKELLHQAGL